MKYSELVDTYEKLDSTQKRLEKTHYLAEALKNADDEDLEKVVLLIQGNVFPAWQKEKKLGFSNNYMVKAIQKVTGMNEIEVEDLWAEVGDLGNVAEELVEDKKQQTLFTEELSVEKVFDNIRKMPEMEGSGSVERKIQLVAELLSSARPVEAKFIVRTVLEILRLGVAEGTLRDAIAWAFLDDHFKIDYDVEDNDFEVEDRENYERVITLVEEAYEKLNDYAEVARLAKEGVERLKDVEVKVGRPIKVMLAQTVDDIEKGFERVGKPADLEYKYDGFRVQISKKDGDVKVFTRRLEDVTKQFPDIVGYVEEYVEGEEFVLDGEAVGYDPESKEYQPFQDVSQRIKRKYNIDEMAEELPVEVNIFDILYYEGNSFLKKPLRERRDLIEEVVDDVEYSIRPARNLITGDLKEAHQFYSEANDKGMEGVMMKNLDSVYKPGSRVGHMVKLKQSMETLDLVIVGADWGEGKRSGWLTSYHLACVDENGELQTIGKVATGIKELEDSEGVTFPDMTERLKPLIVSEDGRHVELKPEVVVEVEYNEIQKSPTYSSGYALRFPRVVQIREDRAADDISSLSYVKTLFDSQ